MGMKSKTLSVLESLKGFQDILAVREEVMISGSFFSRKEIVASHDKDHEESEWTLKSKDFPCVL